MSESHSSSEQQPENNTKGESSLLRASGVTGSMTMVSRILGLARDVVIARVFGVSDGADAFFLANKIPNFMRRLFAEGAFNQAFVPVLSEYRSTKSVADVQGLINAVAGSLGGFLSCSLRSLWLPRLCWPCLWPMALLMSRTSLLCLFRCCALLFPIFC